MWLKINGCDFNLEVATFTLAEFKQEFEHSFCKDRSDAEIEAVHRQLQETVKQEEIVNDGIPTTTEAEI